MCYDKNGTKWPSFFLKRGTAGFIGVVLALTAVLAVGALLVYPPFSGSALLSSAPVYQEDKVDLNQANAEQLKLLPGIGEKKAAAIIAYRESHGPFTSTQQLLQVDGIGSKLYEQICDLVTIGVG